MAAAVSSRNPGDSPESRSRIAGSCRPIRTKRIALSRNVRSDQRAKPCWRTNGDAIPGAHHPTAIPVVTAAMTPEAWSASAGMYAA